MNDLLEKILSGTLTLLLFGWVWNRSQKRTDELEKRMQAIELAHMSREEHLRILGEMATARKEMHAENQAALKELRREIGENEKKRSVTEHAILNVVHDLRLKNAASEAVEKYRIRTEQDG